MANDKQFRPRTRYVATRGVKEYRETIPHLVSSSDSVLELGCEWGTTTRLLAEHAGLVIGADVSREVIEKARLRYPGVRFEVLDAFDIRSLLELEISFTTIYLDLSGISGYRSLLDLIALLNGYAGILRPHTIVVKSGALKDFASSCAAWHPRLTPDHEPQPAARGLDMADSTGRDHIRSPTGSDSAAN